MGSTRALLALLAPPVMLAWLAMVPLAMAQGGVDATLVPDGADDAAALACIAGRYAGTALSLAWVEPESRHERRERGVFAVRWLTPAGNVLDVRVSDSTCRFLLIEGVGQIAARIGP